MIVGAGVLAIGGLGTVGWAVMGGSSGSADGAITNVPETQSEVPVPDRTLDDPASPSASASDEPLTVEEAKDLLQEMRQESLPVLQQVAGSWVPQLSSGCAGLRVAAGSDADGTQEGDVLTERHIVERHLELVRRHDALTVEWFDLGSSTPDSCPSTTMWVALAPEAFGDSPGALGWCTAEGYDADNCAARLVPRDSSADTSIEYNS